MSKKRQFDFQVTFFPAFENPKRGSFLGDWDVMDSSKQSANRLQAGLSLS